MLVGLKKNLILNFLLASDWYYLEKYIISKANDDRDSELHYSIAKEKFDKLESLLKDNCIVAMLDTAAWFCYHSYMKTRVPLYLKKARDYCCQMRDNGLHSSLNSIQNNHIQEIMSTK